MNILIDASSVINLYNAGCLERISVLDGKRFWIGPIVLGECSGDCALKILTLIGNRMISRLDDSKLDAESYLELIEKFGLGPGETECLAAAVSTNYAICTDDGLARKATIELLGRDRLIGSARLLRWFVDCESMACREAAQRFDVMKQEGGFLPNLEVGFFCTTQ